MPFMMSPKSNLTEQDNTTRAVKSVQKKKSQQADISDTAG